MTGTMGQSAPSAHCRWKVEGSPDGCPAIKWDYERVLKWANRNLQSWTKGNAKPCPWGRRNPRHLPRQAGSWLTGKHLFRKGPRAPGGHQVECETAKCPCGKGSQPAAAMLHQRGFHQQLEGGDSSQLCWEHIWSDVSGFGLPRARETWTCKSKASEGPQWC